MADVKWTLEIGEPDHLDGIRSGFTISRGEYSPVAYAFEGSEARLIAAAPDLLAALEHVMDAYAARIHPLTGGNMAYAAIAKATGQ